MTERKAIVKSADMTEDMQQEAIDLASQGLFFNLTLPIDVLAIEKFNVEKDVKVFWDGKLVDAAKTLNGQKPGKHTLLMEASDSLPIRAQVNIRAGHTAEINAK